MSDEVETSGPVFHPEGPVAVLLNDIEESVAHFVESLWLANLNTSIRVNSGRYVSNVNTRREQDGYLVNDNGVIYGPWLEGVGSRNETTRFRGYASLRRALGEVDGLIEGIAQEHVARFVDEMNG